MSNIPIEEVLTDGGHKAEAHAEQVREEGLPREHLAVEVEDEGHFEVERIHLKDILQP